jgi:hypothetical protein
VSEATYGELTAALTGLTGDDLAAVLHAYCDAAVLGAGDEAHPLAVQAAEMLASAAVDADALYGLCNGLDLLIETNGSGPDAFSLAAPTAVNVALCCVQAAYQQLRGKPHVATERTVVAGRLIEQRYGLDPLRLAVDALHATGDVRRGALAATYLRSGFVGITGEPVNARGALLHADSTLEQIDELTEMNR